MRWSEVRNKWPGQWLIIEALEAHSEGNRRRLDRIAVVETCPDGRSAFQRYQALHRQHPQRELLFVHTQRPELEIEERRWLGVRFGDEAASST